MLFQIFLFARYFAYHVFFLFHHASSYVLQLYLTPLEHYSILASFPFRKIDDIESLLHLTYFEII